MVMKLRLFKSIIALVVGLMLGAGIQQVNAAKCHTVTTCTDGTTCAANGVECKGINGLKQTGAVIPTGGKTRLSYVCGEVWENFPPPIATTTCPHNTHEACGGWTARIPC